MKKLSKTNIGVMKQIKKWVDMKTLENVYKLYVRPYSEYGDLVFDSHDMNKPIIFNLLNPKDDISKEIGVTTCPIFHTMFFPPTRSLISPFFSKNRITTLFFIDFYNVFLLNFLRIVRYH